MHDARVTAPTKASMEFLRKRDALTAELRRALRRAGVRIPHGRGKAYEAGAHAVLPKTSGRRSRRRKVRAK